MAELGLLVASGAILVGAAVGAAYLTPRGAVAYLLAVGLLAQAMLVTTIGVAGILLQTLAPGVLLGLALAWPIAILLVSRRVGPPARWRERARDGLEAARDAVAHPVVLVAAALIAGTLVWRAFLVLRLPLVDYDGWSYHMVFLDVWLQHDAITLVPHRPWTAGYPAVAELMATWLAAFPGTDALVGYGSVAPIPLAIVGTIGLARFVGADRRWAVLAGLLLGMTPAMVAAAGSSYVDAASLAAVLATWWLGLRVLRGERDRSVALPLGVAGGLSLGIKGTNLLLCAPVLAAAGVVLLVDAARRRRRREGWGSVLGSLVLLVVPVAVLGMSWYLKNAVVYGNPLYPFAIGPFEGAKTTEIMDWAPPALERYGRLEQVVLSWLADWRIDHYQYNVRPGGLGRALPLILLLGAIGFVLLLRRRFLLAIVLVVVPAAATLALAPNPWYARYTMFIPALALTGVAVVLSRMRPRPAAVLGGVLVALAAISLVFANIHPNIDLRPVRPRDASATGYLGYLLLADDARRLAVGRRATCAGFDVIPDGERVVPGGFNLLHGVAGPRFQRILTDPLPEVNDPAALVAALRERDASWLVTNEGWAVDRLAEASPDSFIDHGTTCGTARIWELRATSP
jgi:hypothetical protein